MQELISKIIRFTRGKGNVEKKVMDLSLSDGVLWSVYSSITSSYLVPLTIFILGSRDPAGLIVGFPLFIVPVAQYFAYHKSRVTSDLRRTTLFITFLDRILWLPLILLLFLNISFVYDVIFIITFLSARTFFASFSGTTWTLWVPFLITESKRNEYFSKRNFYMKIFSLIGFLIGIGIFSLNIHERIQYTVLIVISLIFSTASLLVMRNIPSSNLINERYSGKRGWNRSFLLFLAGIGLFGLIYSGLITYFQYYLIDKNYLGMPVAYYSILMIIISLSFIFSQIFWGRLANIIGNSKSLLIAGILLFCIPLLLIIYHSFISAVAASILFGMVISNSSLNIFNEMLRRASNEKVKSVSSYNTLQSLSQGSGPIIGNFILLNSHYDIFTLFTWFLVLSLLSILLLLIYTLRY
ncbi:MAG: MFS transporter [Thermoplasmata archaeon]